MPLQRAEPGGRLLDWVVDDRASRSVVRARLRGGGREAVSHPVVVDGADAPLREARRVVRGALQRPRDRKPPRLPLRRSEARADRRLPGAEGRVRHRRHVREAADRAAGRHRHRAARRRLDQRQARCTSPTSTRSCATTSRRTWHVRARPLLLHGRRPHALVRLARLGHACPARASSARCSSPTGRRTSWF